MVPWSLAERVRYARGEDWTPDEWRIALDAMPKRNQSYGQSSRDVREVAFLLNRTPSSVSHSFGNLWYSWSDGKHGAKNRNHLCDIIVREYREDPLAFHRKALGLRSTLVRTSLVPRIELVEASGDGVLQTSMGLAISQATGVPRKGFVIYNRRGSILDGVLLGVQTGWPWAVIIFGPELGKRFIRYVESLIRNEPAGKRPPKVVRSETWIALRNGRGDEVECRVISDYLPGASPRQLGSEERRQLASFLSLLQGVRILKPTGTDPDSSHLGRVSRDRKRQIERLVGTSLDGLSPVALSELDALVAAARTRGFQKAVRQSKSVKLPPSQTTLDDYPASRLRSKK